MKKFVNAELMEISVQDTAFGIQNPEKQDSEWKPVDNSMLTDKDGNGFRSGWGEGDSSGNSVDQVNVWG